MPARDPAERILLSALALSSRWSRATPEDRTAATAAATQAALNRFEQEVDPDGVLPADERARRAQHARRAYFTRLALKSHQARRARRLAERLDAEVASALTDEAAA
jgi:hypothetical protein